MECAGERSVDGALDMEDKLQSVSDLDDKLKLIGHPKRRRRVLCRCTPKLKSHSRLKLEHSSRIDVRYSR